MGFSDHARGTLLFALAAVAAVVVISTASSTTTSAARSATTLGFGVTGSRCMTPMSRTIHRSVSANAADIFLKKYQLVGLGHNVAMEGKKLNFKLGSTGPAVLDIPDGVEIRVPRNNEVLITSKDKQKVLDFADSVQGLKADTGKEGVRRVGKGIRVVETLDPVHEKKLKLVGVGYRAAVKGNTIELNLGYSHPIILPILEGVKIEAKSPTEITLTSKDKWAVGQMAYNIREWRKPEPYKGKGIRYEGEHILMKEGKRKK